MGIPNENAWEAGMAYVYVGGLLHLSHREINEQNMKDIIKATNLYFPVDSGVVTRLKNNMIEHSVAYSSFDKYGTGIEICVCLLLNEAKVEPNESTVTKVLSDLNLPVDRNRIKGALVTFPSYASGLRAAVQKRIDTGHVNASIKEYISAKLTTNMFGGQIRISDNVRSLISRGIAKVHFWRLCRWNEKVSSSQRIICYSHSTDLSKQILCIFVLRICF